MGKLQGNATQSPSCWQPRSAPSVERGRWGSQPGPLYPAGHRLCQKSPSARAEYLAPSVVPAHPAPTPAPWDIGRAKPIPTRWPAGSTERAQDVHREGGASHRVFLWEGARVQA